MLVIQNSDHETEHKCMESNSTVHYKFHVHQVPVIHQRKKPGNFHDCPLNFRLKNHQLQLSRCHLFASHSKPTSSQPSKDSHHVPVAVVAPYPDQPLFLCDNI